MALEKLTLHLPTGLQHVSCATCFKNGDVTSVSAIRISFVEASGMQETSLPLKGVGEHSHSRKKSS